MNQKNSEKTVQTIENIYQAYRIPENLKLHMLRVAGCAQLICTSWRGEKLDCDLMLRDLLLHDMGNIVKIPEEEMDQDLLAIRRKYVEKYGLDDHLITVAIYQELGLGDKEIKLLEGKRSKENEETMRCSSFERKICAYCDQRVAPNGVVSIQERLEDAKRRYQGKTKSVWSDPKKADHLIYCAMEIEKQIMKYCTIQPEDINDSNVNLLLEKLKKYEIKG